MRCSHYSNGPTYVNDVRCEAEATHWLLAPDGDRCPGGYMCETHGRECIEEYAEKLGEYWAIEPIDEHGRRVRAVYPDHPYVAMYRASECIEAGFGGQR